MSDSWFLLTVIAGRPELQRGREIGEQHHQRGHDADRRKQAEAADRGNVAGVERQQSQGRGERGQRAGDETVSDSAHRRMLQAMFVHRFPIVIDDVDCTGEPQHVDQRWHRQQDRVDTAVLLHQTMPRLAMALTPPTMKTIMVTVTRRKQM